MLKIELPFWMSKGELKKLNLAAQGFWGTVERWMRISLSKFDLMTCDLIIVDHVAWERKISRLDGEIEFIYRKRVQFAFINAKDAGMNRGIYNIFERLGIPVYDIKERQPGKDWDIVTIEMNDDLLSGNKNLVNLLIQTYGATCRRYEYSVTATTNQYVSVGEMACSYKTYIAELPPIPGIKIDYQLTVDRNPSGSTYGFFDQPHQIFGQITPRSTVSNLGDMTSFGIVRNTTFQAYIDALPPVIKLITYSPPTTKINSITKSASAQPDIQTTVTINNVNYKFPLKRDSLTAWRIQEEINRSASNYLKQNIGKTVQITIYFDV